MVKVSCMCKVSHVTRIPDLQTILSTNLILKIQIAVKIICDRQTGLFQQKIKIFCLPMIKNTTCITKRTLNPFEPMTWAAFDLYLLLNTKLFCPLYGNIAKEEVNAHYEYIKANLIRQQTVQCLNKELVIEFHQINSKL